MKYCVMCKSDVVETLIDDDVTLDNITYHSLVKGYTCNTCDESYYPCESLDMHSQEIQREIVLNEKCSIGKDHFRFARKCLNLKLRDECAAILNVSNDQISRWESGKDKIPKDVDIIFKEYYLNPIDN